MNEDDPDMKNSFTCPVPLSEYPQVVLAHGSGGKLTHQLIQELFLRTFGNPLLEPLHDGAVMNLEKPGLAFTTDSYVVDPVFFPGGDIGDLAVNGTVNDLAMCGAKPLWLSAAFIIEEGFSMSDLSRIVRSMKDAADRAGVLIVTGDTKVVDKGKGDKIFITTSGIGSLDYSSTISPKNARAGDKIILSGDIGVHGIAIMSVREGLKFDTELKSDTAPVHDMVASIGRISNNIHVLRDPTRGGVASALNEIARSSQVGVSLIQDAIPVPDQVNSACELLGLDPLYVANEGKFLAIVAPGDAGKILACLRSHPLGARAALIGEITADHPGIVVMRTSIGGSRIVDMLSGEQLPRIC